MDEGAMVVGADHGRSEPGPLDVGQLARAICPLCQGPMEVWFRLPHIWHQPRGTGSFSAYWCARCGFGSLFPRPSIEELRNYYDNDTYFDRYAGESQEQYQGQIESVPDPSFLDRVRLHLAWRLDQSQCLDARMIAETIGTSPARICEIGCGNGDLLAELKALGHHVVGVEPSENARRRATARGIDVFAGYAEVLPDEVKGRSIDGVIMTMVLDSCSDPFEALRNAAVLLQPGGYLFITVPNYNALLGSRSGPPWFHGDAGRHLSFFTPKSLVSLVERFGLEITRLFYMEYVAGFTNERAAAEQRVWDLLYAGADQPFVGQAPRNSSRRQWGTLVRTLFARSAKKYECVGVIARRSSEPVMGPEADGREEKRESSLLDNLYVPADNKGTERDIRGLAATRSEVVHIEPTGVRHSTGSSQ
jgi:SAM-dependent methyltransferase